MSLIICPECQKEVSSKAPTCPHCGVKIADNIKRCPKCNTFVLMDAQQCPNCKTKFLVNRPDQQPLQQSNADIEPDTEDEKEAVTSPVIGTVTEDVPTDTEPTATSPAEPENTTPVRTKKKGGSSPWWLLILGILVIAIGGFFYWENQNKEKAEEQAYLLLENCNNPLNYEDFIARFPNSTHIDNVRARLQELQREDAAWLEISSKMDVKQLQEFVDVHPNSPYKKAALQKIDSLDWKQADKKGTAAAYDAYITKHDNGEFLDQAFSAREAARSREERARRDSIAAATDSLATAAASLTPAQ